MTTLYETPDHRVWLLDGTTSGRVQYVDAADQVWTWDGCPFDAVAGPDMVSAADAGEHAPLIGLVKFAGLHGDTSQAGALPPRPMAVTW